MANLDELLLTDVAHVKDFYRDGSTGDLAPMSGLENIKNAIFRRIFTEKGAIAHLPEYGVGLKSYQNAPLSLANKRALALEIQNQLTQDPRISEVTSLSIENSDREPDKVYIIVKVKVVGYQELAVKFTPFGEVL
jgi:phage baseplate assembly protein W